MVGVAGKSQGCNTCRRRKVKCDLAKPFCQKCRSASRQCEGYARYPVFINRGQRGLNKRERLEEVKRDPSPSITPPSGTQDARILLGPSLDQANETQLISSFWEVHTDGSVGSPRALELAWLYNTIHYLPSSTMLRQALLSVAYVRLGRIHDKQAMIIKGQQIYGQSLRLMQNALYDHELLRKDEILAAARCMVLYESFESTSGDMVAWQNHILGIARIIEYRGVHSYGDSVCRSILESMRYNVMVVSLMGSKASFLGEAEWLTQPWTNTFKDLDQRLYDHGFALAKLMSQAESLTTHPDPQRGVADILQHLVNSYTSLLALNEELLTTKSQSPHPAFPASATPDSITSATLIALDLSTSIFTLALLKKLPPQSLPPSSPHLPTLAQYTTPTRRLTLSHHLLAHVESSLETQSAYMRPRVLFPLNVVRWELRERPGDMVRVGRMFEVIAHGARYKIATGVQNAGRKTLPRLVEEVESSSGESLSGQSGVGIFDSQEGGRGGKAGPVGFRGEGSQAGFETWIRGVFSND